MSWDLIECQLVAAGGAEMDRNVQDSRIGLASEIVPLEWRRRLSRTQRRLNVQTRQADRSVAVSSARDERHCRDSASVFALHPIASTSVCNSPPVTWTCR